MSAILPAYAVQKVKPPVLLIQPEVLCHTGNSPERCRLKQHIARSQISRTRAAGNLIARAAYNGQPLAKTGQLRCFSAQAVYHLIGFCYSGQTVHGNMQFITEFL